MSVITEKPVVARISDEIFARLETLIDEPNDAFTFRNVIRPTKIATYQVDHAVIVLTRGDTVRVPELDCPGNPPAVCWQTTFLIRVLLAPSERDTTPLEQYEDVAEAEILKAIRNSDTWHTFDNNALIANFAPVQTATGDGGYEGISIPIEVIYRYSEGDPYTVRA